MTEGALALQTEYKLQVHSGNRLIISLITVQGQGTSDNRRHGRFRQCGAERMHTHQHRASRGSG